MTATRLVKVAASVTAAAILLSTLLAPAAVAQDPAIDSGPVPPPATKKALPAEASSRFVVKFKAGAPGVATARANAYRQVSRTSGIPVNELRTTATGAIVVQTTENLTPSESASVVASLRGQANVKFAEPDTLRPLVSDRFRPAVPVPVGPLRVGGRHACSGGLGRHHWGRGNGRRDRHWHHRPQRPVVQHRSRVPTSSEIPASVTTVTAATGTLPTRETTATALPPPGMEPTSRAR